MAVSIVSGVRLAGVASAVPDEVHHVSEFDDAFGADEVRKISESTGVVERRLGPEGMCSSDLCFAAASKLFEETGWERESIDAVVMVSQTFDYILPATACTLQRRLGLSKQCAAFDIGLGCSGYVYGLWIAASLIAGGGMRRVLLLVGEANMRRASPQDRSVALLFGDAGTATFLEQGGATPFAFVLGTDGAGRDNLIVPSGGCRHPSSPATRKRTTQEGGNTRALDDLYMNGAEIFTFTLREVPSLVKSVVAASGWSSDSIDGYVFHQANKFMLEYLVKRMKLPPEKTPIALEKYGNTSSASIPLAMSDVLAPALRANAQRLVLAGFGVGYSWGAVALECGPMAMPSIVVTTKDDILAGWEPVTA